MLRLRCGPLRASAGSPSSAQRRKPAPSTPAPKKVATKPPVQPKVEISTPAKAPTAPEARTEHVQPKSEKPMVQAANFAAKTAPTAPPAPPTPDPLFEEKRAAAEKAIEALKNPDELRKKFKAGKTNPAIADDAAEEKYADRIAPKTPTEAKAAFIDSSTRQRLIRAQKKAAGELVNVDPEYFDPILEGFPLVAQQSKIHGTGLFAKNNIANGNEVFTETPFAVVADVEAKKGEYCSHCMRVVEKIRPFTKEELQEEYNMHGVSVDKMETPPELPSELVDQLLQKVQVNQPERCECPTCKEVFCSDKCLTEAKAEYHEVLCNNPHLKLVGGDDKGTHNMTNLLIKWWARLEVILTKERQNPFDNDFGRLNFEKEVMNQPITTQEEGLQVCKSILNHNSYDFAAHRIGLRVVRKADALSDLKQLQGVFELPPDSLPPTITIGKGKSAKNDWVVMPAISALKPIRGYSLHVLASYFNHSCAPNVVPMPGFNHEISFIAVDSITKGDELTINYIGSMTNTDRATRQRVLKERFHFECNCPRCRAEAKVEM